jgi:hypothetical protein
MSNGHGPLNLSLAKILDILCKLGYTPEEFRDLKVNNNAKKIISQNLISNLKSSEHTCPNIYCNYYTLDSKGNIRNYGKKKHPSGKVMIEEYCNFCGTRFFGNNIIQSYDYNPGLRQYDIEKARERIVKWQTDLIKTCEEMIQKRIPITLTGCFRTAKIPIGKTYFVDRLGLIAILEKYAENQRKDFENWAHELLPNEVNAFLHRIYKRRR